MKKYFITGLIILLPAALTLMIILFLFDFFTGPFLSPVSTLLAWLQSEFHFHIPSALTLLLSRILALVLLFFFILLLGAVARWFFIKNILSWTNLIFSRIPLIKTVYKVSRDIFNAIFSKDGKKAFKRPIIVPFPSFPSYALGFEAGEVAKEVQEKIKEPLVSVFVPTAPHPISGFLFLVEENKKKNIQMSNEEALKFLVSCGMIQPFSSSIDPNRKKNDDLDEIL